MKNYNRWGGGGGRGGEGGGRFESSYSTFRFLYRLFKTRSTATNLLRANPHYETGSYLLLNTLKLYEDGKQPWGVNSKEPEMEEARLVKLPIAPGGIY